MILTKKVNGIEVELTEAEIKEVKARETAWAESEVNRKVEKTRLSRMSEYGTPGEQLDMIYHDGFDVWSAHVKAIKDKHPMPEGFEAVIKEEKKDKEKAAKLKEKKPE